LRSPLHFYTLWYLFTIAYASVLMTATGLTLQSPKIGQTITFLETAEDTGGEALVIEAVMRPGAFMPPHRHLHQEETFEVLEGTGTFTVSGRKIVLEPGERVRIPAGVAHRFRNATTDDVRVRATLRPALRTEELFEQLFRLGAHGKVNKLGAPNPLATMRLIREFRSEFFYLAGVPVSLQRLLAGARR
jgi:quercetin dioxygenase-like cupin family protein